MNPFRSPNSALRRGLSWSAGLIFLALCAYGVWQSARPRWHTYVSPPLTTHGIHLTFRYPDTWKQDQYAQDYSNDFPVGVELTPPPPSQFEMWWKRLFLHSAQLDRPFWIEFSYANSRPGDITREDLLLHIMLSQLARRGRPLPVTHRFKHPLGEALELDFARKSYFLPRTRIYLKSSGHVIRVHGDPSSPDEQRLYEEVVRSLRLRP